MADPIITKIGDVSAYLDAVAHGFEGTRAEFGELLANSANYAQSAESAASAASAAAATATTKAMEATTAATDAQTVKTQAEASATTASTKASEASASATTATTKATEAAASATSAANAASAAQGVLESIPEDYSDLSEDVDQLKADLGDIGVETEVSPNLINPDGVQQYTGLNNDNGKTFSANRYYTTDFIPVTAGKYYSAFIKQNNIIKCAYVPRVCGYSSASEDDFTQALGSISAGNTLNYITIPSGTTHVRLMISTEYYTTYGTFMFCETDGTNKPNEIVQYYVRAVLNGYATTEDKENIEDAIGQLAGVFDVLDFNNLKWNMDNFQRGSGESLDTGYEVIGSTTGAVITNIGEHTKNIVKNPDSSSKLILKKTMGSNQYVCFSGDKAYLVFNIVDLSNFYFLKPFYIHGTTSDSAGFELYQQKNNSSIFISRFKTHDSKNLAKNKWFNIVAFKGSKMQIYNDYILVAEVDIEDTFDGSVGMIFNLFGDESYSVFGVCNNIGTSLRLGMTGIERFINNGSAESVSIESDGTIKLLVDRAQGYSDNNYYRSMLGYMFVRYDNCYCKFSCEFKLDTSLAGADDFLILQWHDNDFYKKNIAVSPFLSINVSKENNEQKIILGSRYANWLPSGNLDCVVMPNIALCDFDNDWHTVEIEARIGYDEDMLPYFSCIFDGKTVYSNQRPLGYCGQNGYNISFGIYGWSNPVTGIEWGSPASEKPYMEIRNVRYIG